MLLQELFGELAYTIVIVVVAVAWFGLLAFGLYSIASTRKRFSDRRSLTDPAGDVWSTRIHWALPGARLGRVRKFLLNHASPTKKSGDDKWWFKLLGNEAGVPVLIGLSIVLIAVLLVLLALELLILVTIVAAMGVLKVGFRHPWTIEVKKQPEGRSDFFNVVGLRRALSVHKGIRSEIPLGRHDADSLRHSLGNR